LMSSVINENENVSNVALAAKQRVASAMEGTSDILSDIGTPGFTAALAVGKWAGKAQSAIEKGGNILSKAKGYATAKDAVSAGRVAELTKAQKAAESTESNLTKAQDTIQSLTDKGASRLDNPFPEATTSEAIDAETGLTSAETDALGAAVDLSKTASTGLSAGASAIEEGGIAATSLGADEAVGAGLTATGVLAPIGTAIAAVGFLGTIIGSAVEAFESHHETDTVSVNLQDLTSLAFDPSHT